MNAEALSAVPGVLLSVECSYLLGVSEDDAKLNPTRKRLVMLGLLVLATVAVFGISCLNSGEGETG